MTKTIIGCGGHAKVVYEIAEQNSIFFDAFIDPKIIEFKNLKKIQESDFFNAYFMGIGGTITDNLMHRHHLYKEYKKKGCLSFTLQSAQSYVSTSAIIGIGTLVAHQAIIQAGASVGENVIINTGAIIEHDAMIEDGCHIAPGAIILGGARIGTCSMIGAAAVILPGQIVSPQTLIPALTRY